ncbi:MAG TPA: lysophospholipid acyltransferase family protein [Methylomirabilota bacterium]|nr:lysophospholipid acyltransferase family protein [Methylomirabilota bacterium]
MKPSGLYRGELWQAGGALARILPRHLAEELAAFAGSVYADANPERRRIVLNNVLPGLQGSGEEAATISRRLFENFARKLIHLWLYESGAPVESLLAPPVGWQTFERAYARGKGLIIVTPHLGNWEFGAPLITRRKIKLQVISFTEPDERLGSLRQKGRERWGVETVFIGDNPFAFVQVIQHLERGGVVALLMDRPPKSAIPVTLFNRRLLATAAAAELARATGCAILPVTMLWHGVKYEARLYDEVEYDRLTLRMPEARQELTQKIISRFEPLIRENLDQWYHFVPIWPV